MKYTRYNLKPKNKKNNNFLLYLAVTLVLALVLGTVINKVLKNSGTLWFDNAKENVESHEETAENSESKEIQDAEKTDGNEGYGKEAGAAELGKVNEFYILQCGAFKVADNADAAMKKVTGAYIPFKVQDGELYRVFAGIYTKETADEAVADLKAKGVDTSRVIVGMKSQDLSSVQMEEGIDGLLQITGKLKDGTVQSVKSGDLKSWCSSLEGIDGEMADYKNAESVKECIRNLPDEVDKGSAQKILSDVYNIIIQYKK